jgi:hypothetical protein
MTPIEQMLRAAATEIDWPATPDIATQVERGVRPLPRMEERPRWMPIRPRMPIRRPLALALAALLLLAATAAAIPGIRDPVLDWLGLRSVHVERVPAPLPEGPGRGLGLGTRTTLDAARKRLAFQPVVPSGLGRPSVYYEGFPPGGQLGLVYPGGVFLTEVVGRLRTEFLFKFVGPEAKVDRLRIGGRRGIWIHGKPHQYAYSDRNGNIRSDTVRTAGNVLLWRHGDLLLRLEGVRLKREALTIARSVRAAP